MLCACENTSCHLERESLQCTRGRNPPFQPCCRARVKRTERRRRQSRGERERERACGPEGHNVTPKPSRKKERASLRALAREQASKASKQERHVWEAAPYPSPVDSRTPGMAKESETKKRLHQDAERRSKASPPVGLRSRPGLTGSFPPHVGF